MEERMTTMLAERMRQQLDFIIEIDKLKQIYRMNILTDQSRHETDAEHSWHLAVMAVLLADYVDESKIDVLRVIKMVLIHDIVEIDAGDTYCYDVQAIQNQSSREQKAANRLFSILPADQAHEFRQTWEEFEQAVTPEARFAAALDRLQPLLLHYQTKGKSWQENGITSSQVRNRNRHTHEVSKALGEAVEDIIKDAIKQRYLAE